MPRRWPRAPPPTRPGRGWAASPAPGCASPALRARSPAWGRSRTPRRRRAPTPRRRPPPSPRPPARDPHVGVPPGLPGLRAEREPYSSPMFMPPVNATLRSTTRILRWSRNGWYHSPLNSGWKRWTSMPWLSISRQNSARVEEEPRASASTRTVIPSLAARLEPLEEGAARGVVLEDVGLEEDLLLRGLAAVPHGGEGLTAVEVDVDRVAAEEGRAVDAPQQHLEAGVLEPQGEGGGELFDAAHAQIGRQLAARETGAGWAGDAGTGACGGTWADGV